MIKEIDLTKMSNFRIHTPAGTYKINIKKMIKDYYINELGAEI